MSTNQPVMLSDGDRAMLRGDMGDAASTAMRLVVLLAEAVGASRLLDVTKAHVDGCLYHGQAGLDFVEQLLSQGAQTSIPTTLNVGAVDLIHPDLYKGSVGTAKSARRQMEAYVAIGCRPTWTCAPYQLESRPLFGEQIAWAESNAIVFANSVLGARTARYGDFIDICCAITGRAPAFGLHLDEHRRADLVIDVSSIPARVRSQDLFFHVLGLITGRLAGTRVPLIVGIEEATEDQLKALGSAAASSGAVGLFHVAGVTPEADTPEAVLQADEPHEVTSITVSDLRAARDELSTSKTHTLGAVSLGTPHASSEELRHFAHLFGTDRVAQGIVCYVSTARDILRSAGAATDSLERAGVTIVVDTCTYITPIIKDIEGVVMTNSAKWAYYAPANIGVEVIFGSTEHCVASAIAGKVVRSRRAWDD